MAKLILSLDGMLLNEFALLKERTTIGRKPGSDILIDNLAISGEHAVVVSILNDVFLEDLDSTNGTNVNSQPIKKHFLQSGDVIELGKYRLKFIDETKLQAAQDDFEKTVILRPDMPRKPAAKTVADAAPAPRKQNQVLATGVIQVLTGAGAGKQMELTKTISTLGKPGVQVAVIARRPHGYFITHVEGAVFPSINGKLLDAQAHPLNDHDIIELAGVKMEFFFKT